MARHCSHCYGRGHNRATCPEIKKNIRENPDGYHARQAKNKARRKANKPKQHRECGYCKETGHNKRTCPNLRHDRIDTTQKNKKFARDFIKVCQNVGFAPGALMQVGLPETIDSRYTRNTAQNYHEKGMSLAMVIGWEEKYLNSDLTQEDKYLGYKDNVVKIRFPNGRIQTAPLPKEFAFLVQASENTKAGLWQIGCPVDAASVARGLTQEWKSGEASVDFQLGEEK